MRHLRSYKRLGRKSSHRLAMLKNLANSLIEMGAIHTTLARAKALKPFVEKMITKAKKNTCYARRLVAAKTFHSSKVQKILFSENFRKAVIHKFGGYTKILHLENRRGDQAKMARIEIVGFPKVQENLSEQK